MFKAKRYFINADWRFNPSLWGLVNTNCSGRDDCAAYKTLCRRFLSLMLNGEGALVYLLQGG